MRIVGKAAYRVLRIVIPAQVIPLAFILSQTTTIDSTDQTVSFRLRDGSSITGSILEEDSGGFRLLLSDGRTARLARTMLIGAVDTTISWEVGPGEIVIRRDRYDDPTSSNLFLPTGGLYKSGAVVVGISPVISLTGALGISILTEADEWTSGHNYRYTTACIGIAARLRRGFFSFSQRETGTGYWEPGIRLAASLTSAGRSFTEGERSPEYISNI